MTSIRMASRWMLIVAVTVALSVLSACASDDDAGTAPGLGDDLPSVGGGVGAVAGDVTTPAVENDAGHSPERAEAAAYRLVLAGLGCDDLELGTFELIPGSPLTGGQCTLVDGQTINVIQFANAKQQVDWTRVVHDAFSGSSGIDCTETVVLTGPGWMISAPLAELDLDAATRLSFAAGGELEVLC